MQNSKLTQVSNARGFAIKDPLQKLLAPTDKAIAEELEFWAIISKEF